MKITERQLRRLIREELERIDDLEEDAPEGWEGTVKKMKKHKEIDNPYALSHWMKKRGAKSRYTKKGKRKKR